MNTISAYLGADFTHCDVLFARLERSVALGAWDRVDEDYQFFAQALERHFALEENVLFSTFEQAAGGNAGPISVMRREHQHLRGIVERMADAVMRRVKNDFFDRADTFRIMLQQHNLKEKNILYVMSDRILAAKADAIIETMDAIQNVSACMISTIPNASECGR